MIKDFFQYISLLLNKTGNILTGGFVGLLFFVIYSLITDEIDPSIIIVSIIIALLISSFLLWRQPTLKIKKIKAILESSDIKNSKQNINTIEEKLFSATKAMEDIRKNIGLDWVAFSLNKTYKYTETYSDSLNYLGTFINVYMSELFPLFKKYEDSIYNYNIAKTNSYQELTEDEKENINKLIQEFFIKQSELYFNMMNYLKDLREKNT